MLGLGQIQGGAGRADYGWILRNGMRDRARIHAGQPQNKPKTGLYWGKARVVPDMTDNELVRFRSTQL